MTRPVCWPHLHFFPPETCLPFPPTTSTYEFQFDRKIRPARSRPWLVSSNLTLSNPNPSRLNWLSIFNTRRGVSPSLLIYKTCCHLLSRCYICFASKCKKKKEKKRKERTFSIRSGNGWKHGGWNGMDKIAPFLFPPFPTFHSFHQTSPTPPQFYLAKAGSRWVVENRVRAVGGGQAGRQLPRRERYSPEENTKGGVGNGGWSDYNRFDGLSSVVAGGSGERTHTHIYIHTGPFSWISPDLVILLPPPPPTPSYRGLSGIYGLLGNQQEIDKTLFCPRLSFPRVSALISRIRDAFPRNIVSLEFEETFRH